MSKKHDKASGHYYGDGKSDEPTDQDIEKGTVVLTVPRVDANHKECPAGSVIALAEGPDVEGWPAHRVEHVLRNGFATVSE